MRPSPPLFDRILRLSTSALLLVACGDDSAGGDTDTDSGTGGASLGSAGSTDPAGSGPATTDFDSSSGDLPDDDSSTGDPITPPTPTGDLAGGIQIGTVTANQAVDIPIVVDGASVASTARVAPLIAGRRMLVRADYSLDADFSPRTIIGRLSFDGADGVEVFDDVRDVSGIGNPNALGGTFQWVVPPGSVRADASYRVEFFEEEGSTTVGTLGQAAVPADGAAPLDAWGDPMVLDIVLVPFSCGGEQVAVTPEDLADFEAFLINTYPITELNLEVHDVVPSASCSEFDAAEYDLPALREAEGADPWVYYGGLLPGDGGGYSIAIQDSDQMSFRRTFANHAWRWYGLTFDLFAHELGHNHGRLHTFEDGGYPGDNSGFCGTISGYGWGVTSGRMPKTGFSNDIELGLEWIDPSAQLIPPTMSPCDGNANANENSFSDMMSYAYPYWVSAYSYAAYADRVRLISSWRGSADQADAPTREVVRVVVDSEGRVHESRHRERFAEPTTAALSADCAGASVDVRVGTAVHDRRDAQGRWVEDLYTTYTFAPPPGQPAASCLLQTVAGSIRPAD